MREAILLLVVMVLAGCASEEPRSVQWFKDHEAERKAAIEGCSRNAVPDSVECMNAQKAENMAAGARRGYVKPKPVTFD